MGMTQNDIAISVAKTLQWAADKADCPIFTQFEAVGDEVRFLVIPGDQWATLTVATEEM